MIFTNSNGIPSSAHYVVDATAAGEEEPERAEAGKELEREEAGEEVKAAVEGKGAKVSDSPPDSNQRPGPNFQGLHRECLQTLLTHGNNGRHQSRGRKNFSTHNFLEF